MNKKEQNEYVNDLIKRRNIAHKKDLNNENVDDAVKYVRENNIDIKKYVEKGWAKINRYKNSK